MTSPRASRSTHERNLERDIEQRLAASNAAQSSRSEKADAPREKEDVAGRLAREAAIREAARRVHERTS